MKSLLPPRSDPQLKRPAGEGVGRGGDRIAEPKEVSDQLSYLLINSILVKKKPFTLLKNSEFANYKTIFKPPIISSRS